MASGGPPIGRVPSGGAARAPPTHDQGLQSISSGEIAFQLLRDLEVGAPSATANGPAPAAPPPRGAAGAAAAASAASHPAARPLAPSAGAGAGGAGGGGFAPRMESLAEAASGDVTTGTGDDNCLTGTGDDLTCDEAGDDTTDQFDVAASPFCAAAAAPLRDGGDDAPAAGAAGMGARSGKGKPDAPGRGLNAACQPSVTSGPGGGGGAPPPGALAPAGRRRRRLVVMRRVMRDAYEYHGLNELGLFFTFAVLANFVLYFHWTDTTAAFKNTVQYSFRSYGNPDWQSQSLANVDTMLDGIEYMGGWAQFWIQRAMQVDWPKERPGFAGAPVRVGEYADVVYARLLVNLDNNCGRGALACYRDEPGGVAPGGGPAKLLKRGWHNVGSKDFQQSTQASSLSARLTGKEKRSEWYGFTIVSPLLGKTAGTREQYLRRLYSGITPNTAVNYDDATAAAAVQSACGVGANETVGLSLDLATQLVSCVPVDAETANSPAFEDLKPFLSRNAYALVLEVLAIDVMSPFNNPDMALFSMNVQRADVPSEKPDRVVWQITTTLPVRSSFYARIPWDATRGVLEGLLLICVAIVLSVQAWQYRLSVWQSGKKSAYFKEFWNVFEMLSSLALCVWVVLYAALAAALAIMSRNWRPGAWNSVGSFTNDQMRDMSRFAYSYNLWLFGGILVDALVCLRILRYMRIHPGLKAFYQVFIIAAREFLDFAVFLLYILLLLGSAIFAFFQLTGGNDQFVRFSDGLSVMTRLTFGFLSYEDFSNQALGLGSAVSAVTLFFWCGVLLLVVFSQNIILAIVAEAYEEAKALLGSANTSFVVLIFLRVVFLFVRLGSRLRRLGLSVRSALCGGARGGGAGAAGPKALRSYGGGASFAADEDPLAPQMTYQESVYVSQRARSGGMLGSLTASGMHTAGTGPAVSAGGSVKISAAAAAAVAAAGREAAARDLEAARDARSFRAVVTELGKSMMMEDHDERMYREMLHMAQKTLRGRWGGWARRFWAPWAVVRTPGVRSLMALYQDFASLKLKTQPPWLGAQEAAQRVPGQPFATDPSVGGFTEASDGGWGGGAQLPDLSDGGVLDAEELEALLMVVVEMGRSCKVWPNPFSGLRERSIPVLAQAILAVYGFDDEEEPQPGGSVATSGAPAPCGGGGSPPPAGPQPLKYTKDLRLGGSMGDRDRSGGFFSRLKHRNAHAAAGERGGHGGGGHGGGALSGDAGGPGGLAHQMRAIMVEQRRLEDQITRSSKSTEQLIEMIARQLTSQKRTLDGQGRTMADVAAAVERLAGAAAPPAAGAGASITGLVPLASRVASWNRRTMTARSSSVSASPALDAAAASATSSIAEDAPAPAPAAAGANGGADGGGAALAALQQRVEEQQKMLAAMMDLLRSKA